MKPCVRIHRFRSKSGAYVTISTSATVFVNHWTKENESVICKHHVVQ